MIWPVEARLDADDVYWGTRLACVEMIRTGTVRFWDMYWQPGATARAVEDAGLRATIGAPLIDVGDRRGHGEAARGRRAQPRGDRRGPRADRAGARPARDLHGQRAVAALDRRGGRGARSCPSTSTSPRPRRRSTRCVEAHGARPADYLDRLGLLGPRTLLAHGVWLDDAELELIAARGATVVTNPVANLKLAVGRRLPLPGGARGAASTVGLGTDGAGSNNSLDLFADMKIFALLQKHEARDPAAVTAAEAWEIATGRRSPLLGGRRPRGRGSRPTSCCCARTPRSSASGDLDGGPRLRGLGRGRRHDRRRRPGADARRRGRGRRRGPRPGAWNARGSSGSPPVGPAPARLNRVSALVI